MIKTILPLFAYLLFAVPGLQAATNRIHFNGQDLFLSGINLAWRQFADDIGPNPNTPDTNHFIDVFDQINANGGNSMRLWLHTTGANSPAWSGSLVIGPGDNTIADLQRILDLAWERKVGLILCLWSFDMLRTSNGSTVTSRSRDILTDGGYRQAYITNSLIPMVEALKGHPGIIAWEIFNEPEGMSDEFFFGGVGHVPMSDIQAFVNQCAGAIHRTDPKAKVSNGSWSFYATTDVGVGNFNYYTDARLIATGGDTNGFLDFYMVHYYDGFGTNRSPFQQPCSYWALDKPLVVAEFYPPPVCVNCGSNSYENLFQNGYAGALAWSWTDSDHAAMLAQLAAVSSAHPTNILIGTPDQILEMKVTPPSGEELLAGSTNTVFVRVSDIARVTNATVTGTISTGGTLIFLNNGVPPDLVTNDSVYTTNFIAPTGVSSVTLTIVATAPGKTGVTNTVTYFLVPPPPNDYFTNAIKIPAVGGVSYGTNKFATRESGEPLHASTSSPRSLWWNWSPPSSGPVLLDTGGSTFDTVLAVYTGNNVSSLTNIASVNNVQTPSGTRLQGYVSFNAIGGTTYRIAVAGFSANQFGTIQLRAQPNWVPDTNSPAAFITSPGNGTVFSTYFIAVGGVASDLTPNSSGLSQVQVRVRNSPYANTATGTTNWSTYVYLNPGANTIEARAFDSAGNQSALATITVTYAPPTPGNDHFINASNLTSVSGSSSVNTVLASKESGEPNHANNGGGKSVWWNFTAPSDGVLYLSTSNSTFDTILGLYTGTAVGSLTSVAYNDDSPGGGLFSELTQAVIGGQIYRIAVDGYAGASGTAQLLYSFTATTVYTLTITNASGGSVTPSSGLVASNDTVVLTALPNQNYGFSGWTGSVSSLNNPLSIVMQSNVTLTASFSLLPHTDGFESGNLLALGWTQGGNAPWIVQSTNISTGSFAARSGVIGNSQTSSLLLTREFQSGIGDFDYKVSSESGFDTLDFLVDGIVRQQWSGESGWDNYPFSLTAGTHTLEWRYSKDSSTVAGLDAAFIDNVDLPVGVPINASSPAQLSLRLLPDGSFVVDLTGQANQTYVLQASTDLTAWQSISTNVAAGGEAHIPVSNIGATRYYRAFVPVP